MIRRSEDSPPNACWQRVEKQAAGQSTVRTWGYLAICPTKFRGRPAKAPAKPVHLALPGGTSTTGCQERVPIPDGLSMIQRPEKACSLISSAGLRSRARAKLARGIVVSVEKLCTWCHGEMPANAAVCKVCNRYQRRILNWFPNAIAVFAVLPIFFSGVLFVFTQSKRLYDEFTWKDSADIWLLDSNGESVVRNTGDGDVFASRIELSHGDFSLSFEVGEFIERERSREVPSRINISGCFFSDEQ